MSVKVLSLTTATPSVFRLLSGRILIFSVPVQPQRLMSGRERLVLGHPFGEVLLELPPEVGVRIESVPPWVRAGLPRLTVGEKVAVILVDPIEEVFDASDRDPRRDGLIGGEPEPSASKGPASV